MLDSYLAPFKARFQSLLQYRAAALSGFFTQCWWGSLKIAIYAAFYGHAGPHAAPLSLSQTVSYTWLSQGLLALSFLMGDPDVAAAVRSGAVAHDRLRPVDTYWFWFARGAALTLGRALPRFLLMVSLAAAALPLLGLAEWSLRAPALSEAVWFVPSLVLGALLSSALVTLLSALIAWTGNERGVNSLGLALLLLFSGSELPLRLYPEWAQRFLHLQPLASLLDTPFRIYLGDLDGSARLFALALQAFWLLTIVLLGRASLERALGQLEVHGG
jgi:ABC-2 type transport system permease protein